MREFVHDAKILLSTIRGYAELLYSEVDEGSRDHVLRILRSVDFMENLLESAVKVMNGDIKRERVELCELVGEIVDLMEMDFKRSGREINLVCDESVVNTDPDVVARVVLNILQNALRHGEGNVVVEVRGGAVSISDEGAWKGKKKGLGMSIVERLLEMVGGSLEIVETDRGKDITVRLGV